MSLECYQEVANDLEKLIVNELGYDVIIYAGENENMKELHAHSPILCTRSQYFCAALSNEWAEKKDGRFIFKKPNISPELFKLILRFIYCGKIDLTKLRGLDTLKLLIAVDELNIQTLIPWIQEYLIKYKDEFIQQNPIEILEIVYQYELFTDLWNYYLEKICEEPHIIFDSDEFINLKAPLLELFLKRDDLNLGEMVIWDSLMKWGLAQNPSIQQDAKKWSKEEISIMERTLHKYIPLIRFYDISPEDFLDKVYPMKIFLPEDLISNLLTFHILPNRKINADILPPRQSKTIYDSIIIERKHFAIFASWIYKQNKFYYNLKNIPCKFNLLYRKSRDGNTPRAFHENCDDKGATIVIAKLTNSEQIIGGYNPLEWDTSDSFKPTKDSFVFSFLKRNDLQTIEVSYPNDSEYRTSIYCYSNYGPTFGGGHDLYCKTDGSWASGRSYSYSKIFPTLAIFDVEDYEVFQVVKK